MSARRRRESSTTALAAASHLPGYLSPSGDGCRLRVHVQPRAKTTEITGTHGDRLKLRVAAPPSDGAANAACAALLAHRLGVPRAAVRLVRGAQSRDKEFVVQGLSAERARAVFEGSQE